MRRGFDKDFYDFAYILLHNDAGGPQQAASLVRTTVSPHRRHRHEHDLGAAVGLFTKGDRRGAVVYARESIATDPTGDPTYDEIERFARLVEDAAAAAQLFLTELTASD